MAGHRASSWGNSGDILGMHFYRRIESIRYRSSSRRRAARSCRRARQGPRMNSLRRARASCATAGCCAAPTRSSMRPPACSPSAAITAPRPRPSPTCSACARPASTTISRPRKPRSSSCASAASTASSKAPKPSLAGAGTPLEKLSRLIAAHLAPNETKRDYVKVFINERRYLPDASRRRIGRKSRRIERCFEDVIRAGIADGSMRAGRRRAPRHAGRARHVQQRHQLARRRPGAQDMARVAAEFASSSSAGLARPMPARKRT